MKFRNIHSFEVTSMSKFWLLLCFLFLSSSNFAQQGWYVGLRTQAAYVIPRPSESVKMKGGFGGGLGFEAINILNADWEMAADATMTFYSLKSEARNYNGSTWETLGFQKVTFLTADGTYTLNRGFGDKQRFKMGFGIWCGGGSRLNKSFTPTYWGNSNEVEKNYILDNDFFSTFDFGLCATTILNFDIFQLSIRYKHGFRNISNSDIIWRQSYVQTGFSYFFGADKRGYSNKSKSHTKTKRNW